MPQRNVATNFTFEQQRAEINLLAQDFWTQKGTVDTASTTYLKHDGSNNFTGATLAVPNAFTINPNSGGGTVTIAGNLDVTGTTTTVSSANLEVTDKNILISKGSTSDSQADGAGITIDSATDITWNFVDANDAWVSSIGVEATTHVKAARGQFTGGTSPTTGSGVEINAPDPNTGQIQAYDRGNSAYKDLRLKGASVAMYAGSTNVLVGGFHNTGLTMESGMTITSSGITVNGNTGIEIAGDNTVLKFTENDANPDFGFLGNAGSLRIQDLTNTANLFIFESDKVRSIKNFDAEAGLDVSGNTTTTGHVSIANDKGIFFDGTTTTNDTIWRNSGENSLSISSRFDVNVFIDSNNDDTNASFTVSKDNTTKASATELFRVNSAGEVLIGRETKPNDINKLVVTGTSPADAYDSQLYLEGSETTGADDTGGALAFGGHDGSQYRNWANIYGMKENATGGNSASYMSFHTRADGGNPAEKVRITSGGNVGINNDNPTVKLSVDGGTTNDATVVQIKNDSTSAYAINDGGLNTALSLYSDGTDNAQGVGIQFYLQKQGQTGCISEIGATRESSGNSNLVFRTRQSSSGVNERMRLSSDGKLLIGSQKAYGAQSYYDDFTINNSNESSGSAGSTGITLLSGNNTWAAILFGDSDDDDVGSIKYSHIGNYLRFTTDGATRMELNSDGDMIPEVDNTQDLGSASKRWANVYTGDMHLNNMNSGGNDVDGSEGHWTMQEGSDDLFLINRNTGKKYKFNLTEVS